MKREWLIKARKSQNKTQEDVADIIGVARQTYLRYESGERTPNAEIALLIERALGVPKEKFFWPDSPILGRSAVAGATA